MQEKFNLDLFVAKWYCSYVHEEDLPGFAADALEAGYDGPALRRLAGLMKPRTSIDVGDLFQRSLVEIGTITIHNEEQAAVLLAKTTARDILEEKIDPIRGAIVIGGLAHALDYPAYLNPFYELAEVAHLPEQIRATIVPGPQLIKDIIEEAARLLDHVPG